MGEAAEIGHPKLVQWLFTNRNEGCTPSAISYAAGFNHFEVVLFLHSQCHTDCMEEAALLTEENDYPEMRTWILEHYPALRDIVMEY
ncbi:hypothetical protein L917_16230 [Phytophthora nicotianae]|uniref:Ankyrin repeat protein n=1 Tax=Phytophthora nicotianae TaxID=4792 RepID=W2KF67_PHYNI|nr:hypothetical protein L917_16230 [Phytophthora nicotianae]